MTNFFNMTQEELISYVECDEHMSDSGLKASELNWSYKEQFSIESLISNEMNPLSKQEWIEWISKEQEDRIGDFGYDSIRQIENYWLKNPTIEPIIIALDSQNKFEIWDGFHRTGIAIRNNLSHVPVIVGIK